MSKYKICGTDRNNKRFVINTDIPQYYNIWKGNLWKLQDNNRYKLIYTWFNY